MKKTLFSLLMLALVAGTTQAQDEKTKGSGTTFTSFGVKAGVGFQNFYGKEANGDRIDTEMGIKWHLGVNAEIPVASEFYFQPGVTLATKGAKVDKTATDPEVRFNLYYVDIPLSLVFKPGSATGTNKFLVGFGPYIGFGIGGKVIVDDANAGDDAEIDVEYRDEVAATDDGVYFKRMDAGANVFVGYELNNKLTLQLNSQIGLANISPKITGSSTDDTKLKNIGFGLSLGYRFGR